MPTTQLTLPVSPDNNWQIHGTGDFDGDRFEDILWRHSTGAVKIWIMEIYGVIESQLSPTLTPGNDWQIKGTGDFDGDGRTDILWRNNDGTVAIWIMDGGTIRATPTFTTGNEYTIEGVGDFNGDGISDILWRHTNGNPLIWFMDSTVLISWVALQQSIATNPGIGWEIQDLGDFNGDGKADILWRKASAGSPAAGTLRIFLMNGSSVLSSTQLAAGTDWTVEGVRDFNNDRKADILWRHTSGLPQIWYMDGPGALAQYYAPIVPGPEWQIQGTGPVSF
jgi:hypothetical protein